MIIKTLLIIGLIFQPAAPASDPDAATATEKEDSSSLAFIRSADLLLFKNRLLTKVVLDDGKEYLFLIDNGFNHTAVDPDLANGDNFVMQREGLVNCTGQRDVKVEIGRFKQLRLGQLVVEDESVSISPLLKYISRRINKRVRGVIGTNLMSRYLTTIDLSHQMIFFRPNNEAYREDLLERPGTIVVPLKRQNWSARGDHIYAVEILINGKPVDACIDLGFQGSILTTLDPVSLGMDRCYRGNKFETIIAGFKGMSARDEVREVVVGNLRTGNAPIILFEAKGAPALTLIGVEFLDRFVFTIDYKRQQLILNPVPSKSDSIEVFVSSQGSE